MRVLTGIAVLVPILVLTWVLTSGPWPAPAAQIEARHAADSLTRARLATLGGGDVDGWGAALRPDALSLAHDADTARVGRDEAMSTMRRRPAGARPDIAALAAPGARLATGATRRGRLAWAAIAADDRSGAGGDGPMGAARHTVAWLLRDDEWGVLLDHHAQAPTWEELRAGAVAGRFPPPAPLAPSEGRAASKLARRFERAIERYGRLRPDRQAVAVGPAGPGIAAGDSAVTAMLADWERRLGAPRITADGLSVRVPRRRGVGWVSANLTVSPPDWGGVTLPLRLTAVYRERGKSSWGLVLLHLSVAAPHPAPRAAAP